jgi:hypothetical protein
MLEVEEPEFIEPLHAPSHTAAAGKAGLELAGDMVEDNRSGQDRRSVQRDEADRREGDRRK